MTGKNEAAIKGIVGALRRLNRAVQSDTVKMSRKYGVTGSQGSVIRTLLDTGELSSAELSRRLGVTPSNMTGLIDRLVKKRIVERVRKEGDRRVALIRLTEKGVDLGKKLPDPLERKLITKLADLDVKHVKLLASAMEELLKVVRMPYDEPLPEELEISKLCDPE